MLLNSDVRYKVSVLKSDFQKRNKKLIHFLNRICKCCCMAVFNCLSVLIDCYKFNTIVTTNNHSINLINSKEVKLFERVKKTRSP